MSGAKTSLRNSPFSLVFFVLLFSGNLLSQVRTANAGSWIETNTWQDGVVPGINDVVLQDVLVQNDSVVIPTGSTIEINNLTIDGGGKLVVNGTLIIHENFFMTNTSVGFSMGSSAAVIVYGNFEIKNQVEISLSSFLVVYGNFTKSGSSNQGDVTIEDGNIYILGDVNGNGWPDDFGCTTDGYEGSTPDESQDCDYGGEQDFEDNQDTFPEELIDYINCYDLSDISSQIVCPSQTATFNVAEIADVNYQWQEKTGDGDWTPIGSNSNTLSVPNVSLTDEGNFYRVIVKPAAGNNSNCKISISRNVSLSVNSSGIWTGQVDTNWNNTANWSCSTLPTLGIDVLIPAGLTNYPSLFTGATNALARKLTIEAGASVIINNNWIRMAGDLQNSGILNVANGSVSLEGTTVQNLFTGAFTEDNVLNLNIKNSAGVTSNANIRVLNSLKVEEGTFDTGNSLLLVSDSSGTAYIDGSGNGQVTGTTTMQRYLSNAFGYKYFSTPFQNSTVANLAANFNLTNSETGFPHLYEYLENRKDSVGNDLTGWQKYLDSASALQPGIGYAINPSGETIPLTLQLSGQVNNGVLEVALQNNTGTYTNGFNLVGNPYPSPIDWNLMVPNLNGIDNAIHFFTATAGNRYTGTYTSFVDGISTDGRSSSIIPSMQGFFVRVSDPIDGNNSSTATLQFTNAVRTGNQAQQAYYKTQNKAEVPQIRLTAAFKDKKVTDATVIYFRNGGTPEFEKEIDAQKLLNTAIDVPSFYSLSNKKEKLSINAVSGFGIETVEIPLGISTERSGEILLTLSETRNIFASLHIYLRDNKKKVLKDLDDDHEYSFTSQKGENNDRFVLVFSSRKLSAAEIALATEGFIVYNHKKEIVVKLNLLNNNKGKVILSSMSGQILQSKSGTGKEEIRFSGIMTTGIYLVTLETEKESQTKKVMFKD